MELTLSDEQRMIRDAAAEFLERRSNSAAVRAAMESSGGVDLELWDELGRDLGWCGTAIDERFGGMGLDTFEQLLLHEQIGRHLVCAPFLSSIGLVGNVLTALGNEQACETFLPQLAAGRLRATLPVGSRAGDWDDPLFAASSTATGWILSGHAGRLPDGLDAGVIFVFARLDGGDEIGLFGIAKDAPGVVIEPVETWDLTRRSAALRCESTPVSMRCDEPEAGRDGRRVSAARARLYLAAEAVGAAQASLDMTVAYTAERKQFGRAVAGFQAVKHRCAQMMIALESARSAVYGAAASAASASADEFVLDCLMARATATEAQLFVSGEAIQLHGGVGFTWEFDPQLHFKRAWTSRHWLGDPTALRARIADSLL